MTDPSQTPSGSDAFSAWWQGLDSPALVLIDLQAWIVADFAPVGGPAAAVAAQQAAELVRASGHGLVLHVRNLFADGSDGGADSPRTQIVDPIVVREDEPLITKHAISAFEGTDLHQVLQDKGVRTLVVGGLVTEGGVRGAALSARELGYPTIVLEAASSGRDAAGHQRGLDEMTAVGCTVYSAAL